jgi:hypothetical protein
MTERYAGAFDGGMDPVTGTGPDTLDAMAEFALQQAKPFTAEQIGSYIAEEGLGPARIVTRLFTLLQPYMLDRLADNHIGAEWAKRRAGHFLQRQPGRETIVPRRFLPELVPWRAEVGEVTAKRLMWRTAAAGIAIEGLLLWMDDGRFDAAERVRILLDMERMQMLTAEERGDTVDLKMDPLVQRKLRYLSQGGGTLPLVRAALAITT